MKKLFNKTNVRKMFVSVLATLMFFGSLNIHARTLDTLSTESLTSERLETARKSSYSEETLDVLSGVLNITERRFTFQGTARPPETIQYTTIHNNQIFTGTLRLVWFATHLDWNSVDGFYSGTLSGTGIIQMDYPILIDKEEEEEEGK